MRCWSSRPRRYCASTSSAAPCARRACAPGSTRWRGSPPATSARWAIGTRAPTPSTAGPSERAAAPPERAPAMPTVRSINRPGTIAVALHGIEPATFERCALIRDWLDDHGIDRVTLLVIPARDLHPVGERSPGMVEWLCERRRAGDAIAQHGFQHVRPRNGGSARRLLARAHGQRDGEFVGLDDEETRRAVHAGWRLLKL